MTMIRHAKHTQLVLAEQLVAEYRAGNGGNFRLAGQALVFSCTVTEVREATSEELAHGHVHGPHGHHH